jgi:hypothetical protein
VGEGDPQAARRRDAAARHAAARAGGIRGLRDWLEAESIAARPADRPGSVVLHRLNRTEYANAIRDLLDLRIDAARCCRPTIPPTASTTSPAR